MSTGTFQVPPPSPAQLAGRVEAVVVDSGGNPPDVIKAGDAWAVEVSWELTGTLVPLIAGEWNLRLTINEVAGPNDSSLTAGPIPVTSANGAYTARIPVPAGTVRALPGGNPYQVIVTLGYTTAAGTPGGMGGYVDCGVVLIIA
ncbi:hypothetical protein [Catenuloplanes japonicus]|uniref:hypothetical protein n=1 Tax=Catenuloplanes japonicus TaxID=33876 RepID=UPI0005268AF1|nr:hypothetical protein [Catenuloplanes japonicus]